MTFKIPFRPKKFTKLGDLHMPNNSLLNPKKQTFLFLKLEGTK